MAENRGGCEHLRGGPSSLCVSPGGRGSRQGGVADGARFLAQAAGCVAADLAWWRRPGVQALSWLWVWIPAESRNA